MMANLDAANGNESGIFRRSDTRLAFRRLRISSLRDDDPEGEEQQGYRGSAREQNGLDSIRRRPGKDGPPLPLSLSPHRGLTACGQSHAAFERRCIPAEPRRCAPLIVAFRSKYTRASSPGGGSSLTRLVSRAPNIVPPASRTPRTRGLSGHTLAATGSSSSAGTAGEFGVTGRPGPSPPGALILVPNRLASSRPQIPDPSAPLPRAADPPPAPVLITVPVFPRRLGSRGRSRDQHNSAPSDIRAAPGSRGCSPCRSGTVRDDSN